MGKVNMRSIFKNFKGKAVKHSPAILTGFGIAGMITTTVLAVKATPKALSLLDEERYRQKRELIDEGVDVKDLEGFKLKPVDTVKVAWKCYIPAVVSGFVSTACLIGANSVHTRRNTALLTAYNLVQTTFSEYKDKVVEEIGEKKEKTVRNKINQDKIKNDPPVSKTVIVSGKGEQLCRDGVSGRYFYSDIDTIKRAINAINREMTYEMYVSLSDFYDQINLPHTDVSDYLGWNLDDGLVDIDFGTCLADDEEHTGVPCITLDYLVAPRYDYSKLM